MWGDTRSYARSMIKPAAQNAPDKATLDSERKAKNKTVSRLQNPEIKTQEIKSPDSKTPETKALDIEIMMEQDKVEISEEAKQGVKTKDNSDDFQKMLDEMRGRMRELREGLKQAQEAGEGMAESMKIMIRCIKIAMRIMFGDKVPTEDERYLAENDPALYAKALMMRMEKEDPEEYESLLEDEKDKGGEEDAAEETSGGSTESVEVVAESKAALTETDVAAPPPAL